MIYFRPFSSHMKDIDIMDGAWPSLCSLSQVSQRWRALALFTPPLWANICVSYKYDPSLITSVILICLSRARDSPLHVSLRLYGRDADSQADVQSVFESVCSKASRWKHFELRVYGASLTRHCLNRSLSTPMLEHLTLYHDQDDSQKPIPFILNAPALRHVCLTSNMIPCPWEQLTSFCYVTISSPTSTSFADILPRLSQLRNLDMAADEFANLALSLTVIPNLHTLALRQPQN